MWGGYFDCYVGGVTGNKVALMFPTNEKSHDYNTRVSFIDRARELCRKIRDRTDTDVRLGFGGIVPFLNAIDSYNDAMRALVQMDGSVAHVDDIPIGGNFEENYPIETERAIFEATEKGDEAGQQKAAIKFFEWMVVNYADEYADISLKALEFVLRAETIGYEGSNETYRFQSRADYLPTLTEMNADFDRLRNWYLEKLQGAVRRVAESKGKRTSSVIDRAKAYITEHYADDISLDDVSRAVNISPYYFSKVFRAETGDTFIEYVTNIRIEKAKELLHGAELSMKEICGQIGYADPNYFSRIFKKNVGMTPTEFKEGRA